MPFFVPGDFDLWEWPSNSSEWGTKRIFDVNLAQIHSAVPGIFHTQTKNHRLTVTKITSDSLLRVFIKHQKMVPIKGDDALKLAR